MGSGSNNSTTYHSRSISLPCTSHPILPKIEDQLSQLRSCESTSTSSQSLTRQISNVKILFDCVDELLALQSNHHSLFKQPQAVDELLDGSVMLLDVCGISRDALVQTRDCIQTIQSSLRRKGNSNELSLTNEVSEYVKTRKKVKRTVKRSLKEIRTVLADHEQRHGNTDAIIDMLRDSQIAAAGIFESLLVFIISETKKQQRKKSGWGLVSKLMLRSRQSVVKNGEEAQALTRNGFEDVDMTVASLSSESSKKGVFTFVKAENLRSKMARLESEIQELDEVLECLFRRLVKTRATILNVLSD